MRRDGLRALRTHAAIVAAVVLVATGCSGQDTADRVIEANREPTTTRGAPGTTAADGTTSSTTTTATTLVPLGPGERELWVFNLEVGDCFNERLRSDDSAEVRTIVKVACEKPHDNEVYAEERFPHPAGTTYPGNSFLEKHADEVCFEAFEPFVGISYVVSELEIGTAVPTLESWADGDRDLSCLVLDPGGSQITGSMRGAER